MANLIAIHGFGQAGKDTSADFLEELGFERRAFADPLRNLAEAIDPWIDDEARGDFTTYNIALSTWGYNPAKDEVSGFRRFLQDLGNGCRRVFGDNFWVDQAVANIGAGSRVVWTDCRYNNEGDAVRDAGGIVVKIERPGTGPANDFEAEHHSMPGFVFDYVIQNDGSLDQLREKVVSLAR